MEFTNKLWDKAKSLGFPNAKLKVVIEYNENNSFIGKSFPSTNIYDLKNIVERGVLIGHHSHLQLRPWQYIKDIY